MATLFMTRPGMAVALADEGDVGLPLRVDDIGGSWFAGFKSILTECAISLDGNYQFTHTLSEVIYAYVFGDRIGQVRLSGLSFADACPGGGSTGIELVMGWYERNRIAVRDTIIQVQVGTSSAGRLYGYVTNLRVELTKPEARISQFGMILHVFPASGGA